MNFHPQAGNSLALTFGTYFFYLADYYTLSIALKRINETKNEEVKQYLTNCVYLWAFYQLEK